jgi:hypothetical protein
MPPEIQSTLQIVERLTVSGLLVLIIVIGAWALIAPMRESKFRVPRLVLGWAHERALEEIAYWRDLAMQQQVTLNEATRGVVVRAMNEFAERGQREGTDSEPDIRRRQRN